MIHIYYKFISQIYYCRFILPWLLVLAICSCTSEISEPETFHRNGLVYKKGREEPFTGFVVGRVREGYRPQIYRYKKEYEDGILNGMSKFWYPNGQLESVEPYVNGKIHGVVTRYYDTGQIRALLHFAKGMRGGIKGEMFWDKKGHSQAGQKGGRWPR